MRNAMKKRKREEANFSSASVAATSIAWEWKKTCTLSGIKCYLRTLCSIRCLLVSFGKKQFHSLKKRSNVVDWQ
uniref:Ovule protein n=1 Tax=Echinococcus granulosus TaxID=6210 RepID=A0A068WSF2_ECHGR|nr:hypothetical protein EgrG_001125200 [Echinococcus granulosus]